LEIKSRDPGHAHFGSFYNPYAASVLYISTKLEADTSIRSKVIRGPKRNPKISKLCHVTQATAIWGMFYGPHAGGVRPPSLYKI